MAQDPHLLAPEPECIVSVNALTYKMNRINRHGGLLAPTWTSARPPTLPAVLVFCAVLFNFFLAFVNANLFPLSRDHIIAAEVLILGSALVLCLRSSSREMKPWAILLGFLVLLFLFTTLATGWANPKHLRDVIVVPIFVMLGMTFAGGNIIRVFCSFQAIVLVGAVIEAIAPTIFGDVFDVPSYYVNTRDFIAEGFWNSDAKLFLSSLRPDERFLFESLGIHRVSSVFLEPVSLGNWCVIITIFIAVFWRSMSPFSATFLVLSNAVILVGSDGRFATVTSALILVGVPLFTRLPRLTFIGYLPLAVAGAMFIVFGIGWESQGDDFIGRLAYSMNVLSSLSIESLFGIDRSLLHKGPDSGITYFIITQSIFGVLTIWLAICLLQPTSRRGCILMHSICLYLSLTLLVSFSMFSIKTAGPLWFLYGYVASQRGIERRAFSLRYPAALASAQLSRWPVATASRVAAK